MTSPGNRAAVEKAMSKLADGPQVDRADDPFRTNAVSKDGSTAYTTVTYDVKVADVTGGDH